MHLINFLENETIILLGGNDTRHWDTVTVLQTNGKLEEHWEELPIKLPYGVQFHGVQFLNNNLYIFGGVTKDDEILDSTYKLSQCLQWEKMANMNQKRMGISNSSVILNDQIVVLGGWNEKNTWKSVEMYHTVTNEWRYIRWLLRIIYEPTFTEK